MTEFGKSVFSEPRGTRCILVTARRSMVWISVSVVLVAASGIVGFATKPTAQRVPIPTLGYVPSKRIAFFVPALSDVRSIQVVLNFPVNYPKPIRPDSSRNKAEISKLLGWLSTSKPLGYETSHAWPMLGPTQLSITLQDGQQVDLRPAITETVAQQGDRKLSVMNSSDSEVVVMAQNVKQKSIRLYAPRLAQWLSGGWRKDIPWKPK